MFFLLWIFAHSLVIAAVVFGALLVIGGGLLTRAPKRNP